MRHLLSASLLLATALPAQLGRDEWLVSTFTDFINFSATGGLWHVDAARTTVTQLSGQTPNMVAANCVVIDEAGFAFYGSLQSTSVSVPNPGAIFQVVIAGGAVVAETLLSPSPIDTGSISGIVLVRDRIWFVTDAGNVGWIPKTGGQATIVLNLQANGVLGLGQSITSNGREIFVGTSHTASTPDIANVWELDGLSASPTLRPLVFLNGSAFALSMARDGQVLAGRISGQMWLIDPVSATGALLNTGQIAPQSNCNGTMINPWLDIVGNVPGFGTTARVIGFYDVATNSWPTQLTMNTAIPSGVGSSHEEPFQAFGQGCPGSGGLEPRMSWTGMPMQGQSFTLSLRNGEANMVGFSFLGFSNTNANLGPLPADLGIFGAPGCFQWISDDAFSVVVLDASGAGAQTLTVPVNPALTGWSIFSQWAISSTANNFGFITSDAVQIRFR